MEKLLRILFVISAIAFVTTVTTCRKNVGPTPADGPPADGPPADGPPADGPTPANGPTPADGPPADGPTPAKTASIFKFTAAPNGVTIDTTKDVYKITINPSLLTYPNVAGAGIASIAPAPIFTVTFIDDKQRGFIIPTTADKADAFTTINAGAHFINLDNNPDTRTLSYLAGKNPGFYTNKVNAAWTALNPHAPRAPRAKINVVRGAQGVPAVAAVHAVGDQNTFVGIAGIITNSKVLVECKTIITDINEDSFAKADPAAANDVAIGDDTKTVCSFSLASDGADDAERKAAYKAWATAAVAAAKDDATLNIQKMGFVGIVTGDDTASAITKAAGTLLNADISPATSTKLVKAYNGVLQKVEIVVIAPVK